ncbi:MAG TPA: hypothetical protein DEP72_05300 [Clostridiales bacterium]|nr:MAG: hypothetical protein A2Y18_08535 [Clostridiales bacterium GWD2_32_19]HCC07558.1 hypothetical protein [Clostridiales bacterium]
MELIKKYLTFIIISFILISAFAFTEMRPNKFNISTSIVDSTSNSQINTIQWHKTFDRHDLYSAAYGNGVYVAVGSDGVFKSSTDGNIWTVADNHPIWLQDVVWGKDLFVAVGSLGTILVSVDGKTLNRVSSGTDNDFKSITWNGNMYVAVGDRGTIVTSLDGLNWIKRPLDVGYSLSSIVCSSSKFIACTTDTFNIVLESDNGVDWYTVQPYGNHYGYYNVAYNGNVFIMSGKIPNQDGFITIVSEDGVNWSLVNNPPLVKSITANERSFVAVGASKKDTSGILSQSIYASENGVDWRTHEVKWNESFYSDIRYIYWCGDKYIGLKYTGEIFTSLDALQWKPSISDIESTYDNIIWNGSQIMAFNKDGNIMLSDDGSKWTASNVVFNMSTPVLDIYNLGNKLIVIAGDPATMFIYSDGVDWSSLNIDDLAHSKVLWSGGKFLLITNSKIYVSSNATDWDMLEKPQYFSVKGVSWNGQTYIAVGGQGVIYGGEGSHSQPYRVIATSTDMMDWTIEKIDSINALNEVIWANGQFVAIGDTGTILTSLDGLSGWIPRASGTSANLLDIIWDGKQYITSGDKGTILYSSDGKAWIKDTGNLTSSYISKVVLIGKRYIGLGLNTIISGLSSDNPIQTNGNVVSNKFLDIQNHWAEEYINELASRNIVNGIDDITFSPSVDITRAEFTAIIVRALVLKQSETSNIFSDVKESDWFFNTVLTAYENGILSGYGNAIIKPYKAITREEAMTMITRALYIKEISTSITEAEASTIISKFKDNNTISKWAQVPVAICIKNKIIQGNDGFLKPIANITRAEAATVVMKMLQ